MTVHNSKQEEYYAAQGYQPAGSPNEAAYVQVVEGVVDPAYEPEEYPKWVGEVLVKNEMEEAALISAPAPTGPLQSDIDAKKAARSAKIKAGIAAKKAKKAAEAATA